jgi:hypothetical protein
LKSRFWELEGESCKGGPSEESLLWRRTKADCARRFQKDVNKGVDLFAGGRLDWLQTFSIAPIASQNSLQFALGSIAWGSAQAWLETREQL